MLKQFLTKSVLLAVAFSFIFSNAIQTKAENFEVPSQACELSKKFPTIVVKNNPNQALTRGLYMINCVVEYVFPTITAMPEHYTPIGQYTIDFGSIRRTTELNNKAMGYEKLVTPYWMPYSKDLSTGDYGEYAGWNLFGMHGAPWRTEAQFYGNAPLYKNGTHGCSNMKLEDASTIFEEVLYYRSIGQKVKVFNYL
jgi:lipoprotein-anchoring transpeptidase ErfK/SrfK